MGINKRNVLCNSSASCFLGFNLWVTGIRMQLQKEPETLADCKAERDVSFGWSALFWNQKKDKKVKSEMAVSLQGRHQKEFEHMFQRHARLCQTRWKDCTSLT